MKLILHIDGGSRGNPGPAAAGVVMAEEDDRTVLEAGYYLGRTTNNQAEYQALLRGLAEAARCGASNLLVFSDSELLVRQINGDYRVRSAEILPLFQRAQTELEQFSCWTVRHVRREQNQRADELANLAMDAQCDVVEVSREPAKSAGGSARGRARSPTEGAATVIRVTCRRAAAKTACSAPCREGAAYIIGDSTSAGMCTYAASVILPAVLRALAGARTQPIECPKKGCGAVFELSVSDR